jgi:PAS domain S-box-containing protein
MQYQITPYALLPLCTALISALLAYDTWRRRGDPASGPFIALTFLVAIWSFGSAFELSSTNVATALFWVRIEYIGIVSAPVAWLLMMLAFSERRSTFSRPWLAFLLLIPLITTAVVWSGASQTLFWTSFYIESLTPLTVVRTTHGTWFWVHTAYSYFMLVAGTVLLLRGLFSSSGLYRDQSLALLIGVLAPWLVNILYISNLVPAALPDPTPLSFLITGLAFSWAMRESSLFELGPMAYREVVQQMSDGVVVLDTLFRIVDINQAAAQAIGSPARQLIGQPLAQALSGWPDLVDRYRGRLNVDAPTNLEVAISSADDLLIYDLRVSPLLSSRGRVTGRMLVWRDSTATKQAMASIQSQKERLENQAVALQAATAAAEAGSRAKSLFLATMSHELRTPLSAMLGYTDLIQHDIATNDTEALEHDLRHIRIAGDHLLRMIGDVLDYAKIEAGKMPVELKLFDVHAVIEAALAAVRPLFERHANRLELQVAPDIGPIYADQLKMRQVLINLLSNAAKFTQSGAITLSVFRTPGWPDDCPIPPDMPIIVQGYLNLRVCDTGIGMSADQLEHLFEDFTQMAPGTSDNVGTGLGLSLSQKLCQLMGGLIVVASEPGRGTQATMILPDRS